MKKRVIITGASSGLGLEIAKTFIENGYEVIGLSRNKADLETTHIQTDFSNKEIIENTISKIKDDFSDFSCIICCAGIGYIEKLDNIDFEHTEEIFKINIIGQSYLLSGLSKNIKENNSDLVFIGATIGYKGDEFMPMYSITKWGLRGLIENRRINLKNTLCRVIGVHPGGLNTNSNIGDNGRGTIISNITGKEIGNLLDAKALSNLILSFIELPKNMEVSEIVINRK